MTAEGQGRRRRRLTATVTDLEVARQRAYLIGVTRSQGNRDAAERSLEELSLLTDTAGSDPVVSDLLTRNELDPATFIGRGQAEDAASTSTALDIDVVVFDQELTPAQQRNLQAIFECDVVDRQAVILDIFAQHATSREGMLQVELALLQYHLPRLRGHGVALSRQAGGIGTRGPGETKLETDRRRILSRISRVKSELAGLTETRATQRKARQRSEIPVIALVGYTNAGKSTILNAITGADVLTENRLFSTLDSTVRKTDLPNGTSVLLSDTVGFVRDLPHQLVEAFRSTLEEVVDADLLLHVVDATEPAIESHVAAVRGVLSEIGAAEVPEIFVINKSDIADPATIEVAKRRFEALVVSGQTGDGLAGLLDVIEQRLTELHHEVTFRIPYDRGDVVAALHREGTVVHTDHLPAEVRVSARLRADRVQRYAEFLE